MAKYNMTNRLKAVLQTGQRYETRPKTAQPFFFNLPFYGICEQQAEI